MIELPDEVEQAVQHHEEPGFVVRLLNEHKQRVRSHDWGSYRVSLVIQSVRHEHLALLEHLLILDYHNNLTHRCPCKPLHVALCEKKDHQLIQMLLDHGADVNVKAYGSQDGKSSLYSAMEIPMVHDDVEMMNLLIPYTYKTKQGVVALACKHNASKCLDYLLQHGYGNKESVNVSDVNGITPLMHAVVKSSVMVRKLLQVGANVFIVSRSKQTALHMLVSKHIWMENQLEDTVKVLLDAGVNIDAVEYGGDTALNLLCLKVQRQLRMKTSDLHQQLSTHSTMILNAINMLLARGADVNGGHSRKFIDVITITLRAVFLELSSGPQTPCGERLLSVLSLNNIIYQAGLEHGATSDDTTLHGNTVLQVVANYVSFKDSDLYSHRHRSWYQGFMIQIGKMLELYFNHGGRHSLDKMSYLELCSFHPCLAAVLWQTMEEKLFRKTVTSPKYFTVENSWVTSIVHKYAHNPRPLREMARACVFSNLKAPQCHHLHLLPGPEILIKSVLCSVEIYTY